MAENFQIWVENGYSDPRSQKIILKKESTPRQNIIKLSKVKMIIESREKNRDLSQTRESL